MALPGQRFVVNLSDDDDDEQTPSSPASSRGFKNRTHQTSVLIGDILERKPSTVTPPSDPTPTSSVLTGFPVPRDRTKHSTFKQRRKNTENSTSSYGKLTSVTDSTTVSEQKPQLPSIVEEKKVIDQENRRRIAAMSPAQVEKERTELLTDLPPSLLERLLRRANISDSPSDTQGQRSQNWGKEGQMDKSVRSNGEGSAILQISDDPSGSLSQPVETLHDSTLPTDQKRSTSKLVPIIDELPPREPPVDLFPASEFPTGPIHFPAPPPRQNPMPNLDPSSPSFLYDLQTHYFPDISHDPSSLSWLQPPSRDPEDPAASSPYHPASSASSVPPSAIRFSLIGTILSPNTSLSLPTSLGLHHHANDPEAAGYTIPELAILSRSTLPAQRCIAWQVVGRILFRLGKGQFGARGTTLEDGLWTVVEREGLVARMIEEAEGRTVISTEEGSTSSTARIGRHASAKAWALEGIWLWRMGGGMDRGILKQGTVRST